MSSGEPVTAPNADQIAYWNSPVGDRWAALQREIDAVFAPLSAMALDRAGAKPGENVIDIGCGCGATAIALAQAVGPGGSVLGVDVSQPMLDIARERAAKADLAQARFALSDAATHPFPAGQSDLVFSRFGVMFFDDPAGAFRNIRSALRPGGRLVFACWRPMAENAWFSVPFEAALAHVPAPEPTAADAPGPFAFANADRVRSILTEAGFADVAIAPGDTLLTLGPSGNAQAAAAFTTKMGPTSRLLAEADEATRQAAYAGITTALARHDGSNGIVLGGAIWIVAAANR